MRLHDKKILITGGSRGIGRACVAKMASEGAAVAFVYQGNRQAADELVAESTAAGRDVRAFQADVRDSKRVHELVQELADQWGRLDVLVNSAGIVRDGLLGAMTQDQWTDVIETNLGGTYNFCHAVVQQMMYQRGGSIVNLSSTAAEFASRGQVNYAASKAGLMALTKSAAKELASRGVRVNAVAPGFIETDMTADLPEKAAQFMKDLIPLGRTGLPGDVADVVAFLCSHEARYLTGQVIHVSGGMYM